MDFSSASFPKPRDWQEFERCCHVLFKCELGDPNTQKNGRSGQPQHGVDVFGRRGGDVGTLVGVQCKGKEASTYGNKVTETELRDEVKKAFLFTPRLAEFILATTAPNDVTIQKVARLITEENERAGNPMVVNVYGWDELYSRIIKYPDAIRAFHPDSTPFTQEIKSDIKEVKAAVDTGNATILAALSQIKTAFFASGGNTSESSSKEQGELEAHLHTEIDDYRDLIVNGQPKTGMALLEKLKVKIWEKTSSRIKFRITTNIGAALLRIGEDKVAADMFLSAIEYDPLDKVGMSNVALAYLIKDDTVQAIKAAKDAIQQNPDNEDAACYLIQAHFKDQNVTDPFSLIPEDLKKKKRTIIGAIYFFRKRQMREWQNLAIEAVKAFPEAEEIKRVSAEAILDIICESKEIMLGQAVKAEQYIKDLLASISMLQSIWDNIKTSENKIDSSLPHNLAVSYRIIGEYEKGVKVIDEALLKEPNDITLIKLKAILLLALRREDDALPLLLEKRGTDFDATILTAELLLYKNPGESRKLLSEINKLDLNEEQIILVSLLQVESYVRDDNNETASNSVKRLVEDYPENIKVLLAYSNILRKCDDHSAKNILLQAKDLLNEKSSFVDRFLIARDLYYWEEYNEALKILDDRVDYQRDTPALQLFLSILKESGRRQKAHECIKIIPSEILNKPFYLKIQAGIHIDRGDYPAAENALDKYLQLHPEDISMRHEWVGICIRHPEGSEKIRTFLEDNVENLKGSSHDRMQLAILLYKFDFEERALKLGYKIFLENPEDPKIHVKYMALLLQQNKPNMIDLNVKEIGVDTVFVFENDRNETDYFIIENDESLRKDFHAISPDHIIAKKVIGLHIGDTFIIDNTLGIHEKCIIKSIKHKYLDSLHKCMERFNHQFPSFQGFQKVVFDPESPEITFAPVKARHDAFKNLFAQFEQTPIPLLVLSDLLGVNVIAAWQGIVETTRKFTVCLGTAEERNIALQAIESNSKRGCVTDAFTFYLIKRLGLEDAVVGICGNIGMTESSVDFFRQRLEEIELHGGKPFMVLSYQNGHYVKEDITVDKLQAAHNEAKNDLKWIKDNCNILPAESELESETAFRDISKKFGKNFFDSVLAAHGAKRILLCEDYPYRLMATHNIDLQTTWLHPVMIMARDKNILSPDKYDEIIYFMLQSGLKYISIDARTLLRVANLKTDLNGKIFNKIAEALGGPSADMVSHIKVAAAFLNEIWKAYDPPLKQKAQTGKILECLTEGRRKEITAIIEYLYVLTKSSKTFSEYVSDWLKGHFYLPFNTRNN